MREIKEMTFEELCDIANLITAGYFDGQWSRDKKEVEVGGYGLRRRVEWIMNLEGYDQYHYVEVSAESKNLSWSFSSNSTTRLDSVSGKPAWCGAINICNIAKVVGYCRERELDIDNSVFV